MITIQEIQKDMKKMMKLQLKYLEPYDYDINAVEAVIEQLELDGESEDKRVGYSLGKYQTMRMIADTIKGELAKN